MIIRRILNHSRISLQFILLLILLISGFSTYPVLGEAVSTNAVVTNCSEDGLNAALAQGGTITFQCGGAVVITLSGKKEVTQDTSIDGFNNGFPLEIQGSGTERIFEIKDNVVFSLKNLILSNGNDGYGGAIHNRGRLTVDNVLFTNNMSFWDGGAIFSENKVTINSIDYPVELTVQNSSFVSNSSGSGGGAIYSRGKITIFNSFFKENHSNYGGAVFVYSEFYWGELPFEVDIRESLFENNQAGYGGGGLKFDGNKQGTTVLIENVTFKDNETVDGWGGGADLRQFPSPSESQPSITVSNSLFTNNTAGWNGGGLVARWANVENSTFLNNQATDIGGGLYIPYQILEPESINTISDSTFTGNTVIGTGWWRGGSAIAADDPLDIRNSTINNNHAPGGVTGSWGGAILFHSLGNTLENNTIADNTSAGGASAIYTAGDLNLVHNTITGNAATSPGGCPSGNERDCVAIARYADYRPPITFKGNIIDNGGTRNCNFVETSLGYNLFPDSSCGAAGTDIIGEDAGLNSLKDNGGATYTRMPYTGSPARDNAGADCPAIDQRGAARPFGAACDIGSVEADQDVPQELPKISDLFLEANSSPSSNLPSNQDGARAGARLADPVNAIFGNFTYEHTDLALPGLGLPVRLHRTYNSAILHNGLLGYGWNLAYHLRVFQPDPDTVKVQRGDGRIDTYTVGSGGELIPPPNSAEILVKNPDGSFTLTTREFIVYQFDSAGRLLSGADPDGNTVTMNYSGDQWTGITDTSGRTWSFTYNADDRLSSVVDPTGRTVSFAYTPFGDLAAVTNPLGGTTTYQYDAFHRLTRITDANGNLILENLYDGSGRVIQQSDARGVHTFNYYAGYTNYTDPTGVMKRVEYDNSYRLTARTDALATSLASTFNLSYNTSGLVASQTDGKGNTTSFQYDGRGNITQVTDPLGNTTSMTYDGRDNLLTITDPLGHTSTWTYNASDHPLTYADPAGKTASFTYNSFGLLTKITNPLGFQTEFSYNSHGYLTAIKDPLLATSAYEYDSAGRMIKFTNPLGNESNYTYNAFNLPLTMTAVDGGVTAFAYDAVGNLLSITDPSGNKTSYTYNQANELVKVTNALGISTTFSYDALGRQTSRTNVDGTTWETTYNALGYAASQFSPLGNSFQYNYDLNGNLVKVIDPSGAATQYAYDALDRLTGVTDALGGKASYVYDEAGRLVSVKDPRDQITTYSYDAMGRLLSQTDPLGNTTSYTYDALGRLTAFTNANGQMVNNTYDAMNRLLTTSGPGVNVQFTYDAVGNRTQTIDASGTTNYSYDDMGRPINVDGPRGLVTYSYDLAGRRTAMTQPGMTINYSYDNLHHLVGVNQGGHQLVQYTYDALGRNTLQAFGNGVQTRRSYDLDSRLVSLETTTGTTMLQSIAYTLDGRGNITAENGTNFSAAYTYDAINRLTGAVLTHAPVDGDAPPPPTADPIFLPLIVRTSSSTGAAQMLAPVKSLQTNKLQTASNTQTNTYTFTYDPAGNRLSATKNGSTQTYTYNAANQLTNPGFVYDQAGRLINDGVNSYAYDAFNRLISHGSTQFTYDGDGNRVGMSANGVTTTHLLDTALPLPQRIASSSGGSSDRYVFGAGLVAQFSSAGSSDYFHSDALGSLRLLTNPGGEIGAAPFYAAFGIQLAGNTNFGFAGEALDGELVHLRARDYHPGFGRFLTPDPMGQVLSRTQGLNLYSYVENNPVNFVDPSGLIWQQAANWVGGVGQWTADRGRETWDFSVRGAQYAWSSAQAVGSWVHGRIFGESSGAGSGGAINGQISGISANSGNAIAAGGGNVNTAGGYNFQATKSGGIIGVAGGNVIAAGGGNAIAAGGGNVIAAGGGNVIAAGGGNAIAAGGGNFHLYGAAAVIAAGGGNVIAAGGGNVIAAGGGNVIAAGGYNFSPTDVQASRIANVIAAGGGNAIAAGGGN